MKNLNVRAKNRKNENNYFLKLFIIFVCLYMVITVEQRDGHMSVTSTAKWDRISTFLK